MQPLRILLIEDNSRDAELLEANLREEGFPDVDLVRVDSLPDLYNQLSLDGKYQVVLSDYSLPGFDGLMVLEQVRQRWPEVPFVFVSGAIGEARAIETLKLGATDYVLKHHLDRLGPAVARALQEADDRRQRRRAEDDLRVLHATLEQRVAERTALAERRAAELRRLATEMTNVEQRERERVAEILHEELQQCLFAARLQLSALENECGDAHQERFQKVNDILVLAYDVSRSLVIDLVPPVLAASGLAAAFEWLATRMLEQHQLVIHVDADPEADPMDSHVAVFLLQAVRELLFNVVKHAQVLQAHVTMRRLQHLSRDCVRLEVSDQGQGFNAEQWNVPGAEQRFGLFNIQNQFGDNAVPTGVLGELLCEPVFESLGIDASTVLHGSTVEDDISPIMPPMPRVLLGFE